MGCFFKNVKNGKHASGRKNSAMIADRQKFTNKITICGISSFHFNRWNQFRVKAPGLYTPYKKPPQIFWDARRGLTTWQITLASLSQLQAANHHRLLSDVTLGVVECRKIITCAQIAERFESNSVLWAFHTIQPSSAKYYFKNRTVP